MYYITHYYNLKSTPFLSLSELNDCDAVKLMESLYSEKNEYGKRFVNPMQYLNNRRETEKWVRNKFIKKGFKPIDDHPLYFVFGESDWLEKQAPEGSETGKISIPLNQIDNNDISFTYPDSMVSRWLGNSKPIELYNPKYHGKVFSKDEVLNLINEVGILENSGKSVFPVNMPPYIEAQIWNKNIINESKKK